MPNTRSVLVVDDETLILDLVQLALEDRGFSVEPASSGAKAIADLENGALRHVSALVTDINFQAQPDGWRVARRARQLNPEIAVIYMTGDSRHSYLAKGVPNSVIFQKPFVVDDLVAAVEALLESKRGKPRERFPAHPFDGEWNSRATP